MKTVNKSLTFKEKATKSEFYRRSERVRSVRTALLNPALYLNQMGLLTSTSFELELDTAAEDFDVTRPKKSFEI